MIHCSESTFSYSFLILILVDLSTFLESTYFRTIHTYQSASLPRAIEGLLVMMVLTLVILGHQLPSSLVFYRVTPGVLLITIAWVIGLGLVSKAGKGLPWKAEENDSDKIKEQKNTGKKDSGRKKQKSTGKQIGIFLLTAIITLVAGYCLERTGDTISKKIGMQGILFGATIMAAATSLPEISTGLASMKLKKYDMAVSDIFGGNAFLPVLFLLATLISGKSVLPQAKSTDIYLTTLAMLLTGVYIFGIIFKPRKKILYMGVDSFIVLILYALGIVGLFAGA